MPPENRTGALWFILAIGAVAVALALFMSSAHAACRMWDGMMVCDNGQTFQKMGDDMVVDDWGHTWVVDGEGTIHTDQAYPTPLVGGFFAEEDDERLFEPEERE